MQYIEFYRLAQQLKEVKRIGWLYKDVDDSESVADHTYGVALLALTVDLPQGINREKLIKMSLVHDIAESITGDVMWEKGADKSNAKQSVIHSTRINALNKVFDIIKNDELRTLAIEFVEGKTKTAQFLKELDKLELVFQALAYEKKVHASKLNEFWENAETYLETPGLKGIFSTLATKRLH